MYNTYVDTSFERKYLSRTLKNSSNFQFRNGNHRRFFLRTGTSLSNAPELLHQGQLLRDRILCVHLAVSSESTQRWLHSEPWWASHVHTLFISTTNLNNQCLLNNICLNEILEKKKKTKKENRKIVLRQIPSSTAAAIVSTSIVQTICSTCLTKIEL